VEVGRSKCRVGLAVELQHGTYFWLLTSPDTNLMIVAQRYAHANFPGMPDYCLDLPTSHLLCLDCSSL